MFRFLWLKQTLGQKFSSVVSKMDGHQKAVVRLFKNEDRMEIQFNYTNPLRGLNRLFSLKRLLDESVQQLVDRININIEKASEKHLRKMKKKNSGPTMEELKIDIKIIHNGQPVDPTTSCRSVLEMPGVQLVLGEQIYQLDIEPPIVANLKLPSSIMAGFPVYPSKLEVENCSTDQCSISWFRSPTSLKTAPSIDSEIWKPVGTGFCYRTTNQDIGTWLKVECEPVNDEGRRGLLEAAISPKAVEAGPGHCPFEVRHQFTSNRVEYPGFRVVTYNILADLYADSDYTRTVLHPYCPAYALTIDYRKQLIIKELMGYHADIICLQEVDQKVFDWDLEPTLTSLGFSGVFHKKGGQVSEGLSCFFHTSKFRMIGAVSYTLSEELPTNALLSDIWSAVKANEQLSKRILQRTTILQLVELEELASGRRLVMANTHLYFHPNADHIRLVQSIAGLRLAQHLASNSKDQGNLDGAALVFCGDFNSCPGSGVFELMTLQRIDEDNEAWSSTVEEAVRGLSVTNPVRMGSACGTPPFTNFTSEFHGCLDYIFYPTSRLAVGQVIPLPSLEEITQHTALPSIVMPSDHIALVADLKWL